MSFKPGDPVHVALLGKGTVREVRNGERYLVDIKGRSLVASGGQLTLQESGRKASRPVSASASRAPVEYDTKMRSQTASLDLHGKTVAEALEATISFLNDAMIAGTAEVEIIHGRSGGKIKAAVHAQLKKLASVRGFSIDPRNAGVTIVRL